MSRSIPTEIIQMLQTGRFDEARKTINELYQGTIPSLSIGLALAVACRGSGDVDAALSAIDAALTFAPHDISALILKGDIYFDAKQKRMAMQCYASALKAAAVAAQLPSDIQAALPRIESRYQNIANEMHNHISDAMVTSPESQKLPRFQEAMRLLRGEADMFYSKPRAFYYPGLPHRQFYPNQMFDWADKVMAGTSVILNELEKITDSTGFEPYLQRHQQGPTGRVHSLLDSDEWQALFLIKDGKRVNQYADVCTETLEILNNVPLAEVPGRGPMVLFSRLNPGGHIAPHNGFFNTRLICHLPLVVPPNCSLRVGNETRDWRKGELMIFDDSIEHEAWNRSNSKRDILIFDVWHPDLNEDEREAISVLCESIDNFGA